MKQNVVILLNKYYCIVLEEIFSYMGELSNEERKKIGRNGQEWIHQNSHLIC